MRLKVLTVAFMSVLVVGGAANEAWGTKTKLWFSNGGEHMADGSAVSIGLYTNFYCSIGDEGILVANGKSRDKMIFTSGGGICYNHNQVTGHLIAIVWKSDGTFIAKADMVVRHFRESPGEKGCSYKVTKLAGTFPLGAPPKVIEYKGTGILEKQKSETGCPESELEDDESILGYETSIET